MQRIYEPRDLLEAEMLRGMLIAEGIEVFLTGRHLMVADEQAERARQLIAEYNGAEPLAGDEPESYPGELIC
jgi:hypothetical protein